MPRTVSASEAKTKFGAIADWATQANDDVIVESHGRPKVVIIPFAEYERVLELRDAFRRREALAKLERLRRRVQARNADLSGEQADALASRLAQDLVERMAEEGQIRFNDQ